jgi:hypothetical protein
MKLFIETRKMRTNISHHDEGLVFKADTIKISDTSGTILFLVVNRL